MEVHPLQSQLILLFSLLHMVVETLSSHGRRVHRLAVEHLLSFLPPALHGVTSLGTAREVLA